MPPIILSRSDHPISRKQIDPDALKVLYRLKQTGHVAYLVGGGVRDLLLGRRPKDFDISTSAHPNEVKKLFRNCRLIGRRFRLAHLLFSAGKVIEVATFRRKADDVAGSEDLLVHRENTFGTPEEDATRRDFTINGLFYDIATFSVIDFVGGLRDLESRVVRTIGDPEVRFREDPVRMLRAVKFASRLGFDIAPEDLAALRRYRSELLRAAPERLLLELGRLLAGGSAPAAFRWLRRTGLLDVFVPEVGRYLARRGHESLETDDVLWHDLAGLDALVERRRDAERVAELPPSVLLGVLLTPVVLASHPGAVEHPPPQLLHATRRGFGFAAGLHPPGATGILRSAEAVAATAASTPSDEAEPFGLPTGPSRPAGAYRRRSQREPPAPPASEPVTSVGTLLPPLIVRLCVPRREAERLLQVIAAQPLLRSPAQRPGPARALSRRDHFEDALLVFEAHVLGTREGEVELQQWKDVLQRVGAAKPSPGEHGDELRARGRRRRSARRLSPPDPGEASGPGYRTGDAAGDESPGATGLPAVAGDDGGPAPSTLIANDGGNGTGHGAQPRRRRRRRGGGRTATGA